MSAHFYFLKRRGVLRGDGKNTLLHFDARINKGIEKISNKIEYDKEYCAEENESFEELKVRIIERVNAGRTESGDAEKTFQQKTAGKKERQSCTALGNNRNSSIFEEVFGINS